MVLFSPAVEHTQFARVGVNVAVGAANLLRLGPVAVARAVGDGPLLRDTVADGNLEDVTPVRNSKR